MSLASLSTDTLRHAQHQFVDALPQIDRAFRYQFRRWQPQQRDEAIVDARAESWSTWVGLVRRGKDPLAVGPTGIAANACRHVRAGRRLGTGSPGCRDLDLLDPRSQRRLGIQRVRLDRDALPGGAPHGAWRDWLAEDNRVTPADEVCFKLDFEAWLAGLPARKREVVQLLAQGHETGIAARMLGITPAAVSQARTWLEARWRAFQGDDVREGTMTRRYARRGRPRLRPARGAAPSGSTPTRLRHANGGICLR